MSIYTKRDKEKYNQLERHLGHKVVIAQYSDQEINIECEDCQEVLIGFINKEGDEIYG